MSTATPEPPRRRDRRTVWACRAALALVLVAAFLLRARDARYVFVGDRVVVPGYDTHYHLRRIQKAVAAFPRVPAFDAYVNYPEGADIYWPAGFDMGLAAVARLAGLRPWSAGVERLCAWAIPVLGVALVAATCWLGALWRGRGTGLVAAALLAVVPAAVSVSAVGRVDHDVAAILCATLAFGCCVAGLRAAARRWRMGWSCAGGLLLGGGLWVWPGAIVFVLLAAAFFVTRSLVRADERPALDVPFGVQWTAAAVIVGLCTLSASARPRAVTHLFLSGFHMALAVAGAASLILLWLALRGTMGRGLRRRLLAAGLQIVFVALVAVAVPGLLRALSGAASFVGATADVTVSTTGEGIGLFERGVHGVMADLTWVTAALPVALVVVAWRGLGSRRAPGDWLVMVWAVAGVALAAGQRRFAAVLAVPMALCVGGTATWLWALAGAWRGRRRAAGRLAVVLAVAVGAAAPLGRWQGRAFAPNWELRAILPALEWLRGQAPPAGVRDDFATRPAYGVMAFWHYGHWLNYVAEQASIACPFGNTEQHQRGLARSQEFFGARSEAEAAALCSRLGVRYVLSPQLPVPLLVAQAGLDPRRLYQQQVMATSLHLWRGLRAPGRPGPLQHFRLVGEFDAAWPSGAPYSTRLFEFVRGARVRGRAPGRGRVELRLELFDDAGHTLRYEVTAAANETGDFECRVPYATQGGATRYRARGPAHVWWSDGAVGKRARVTIPDAAVQSAGTVRCDLL